MCSEGLMFLSQCNQRVDQSRRNYLATAMNGEFAQLAKYISESSVVEQWNSARFDRFA